MQQDHDKNLIWEAYTERSGSLGDDPTIDQSAGYDDIIHSVIQEDSPQAYKDLVNAFASSLNAITTDVELHLKRESLTEPDNLRELVAKHLGTMLQSETDPTTDIDDDFRDMMPTSDEPEPWGHGKE